MRRRIKWGRPQPIKQTHKDRVSETNHPQNILKTIMNNNEKDIFK